VWHRGVVYATTMMPYSLSIPTVPGTTVDNWFWLIATTVLITAGFVVFWRRWKAAAVYVLFYLFFVLVWSWFSGRLLVPMIPLGMLALLLGARWAIGWLPLPARKVTMGVFLGLLALGALQSGQERVLLYRQCDRQHPYESSGCYREFKLALIAAAEYLRSHAAPTSVVLTNQPASVNFLSGHRTEDSSLLPDAFQDDIKKISQSRKIDYFLVNNPWMARRFLPSCHELRVATSLLPEVLLLVTSAKAEAASDACSALGEMVSQIPSE
jgi:hypothetical protein